MLRGISDSPISSSLLKIAIQRRLKAIEHVKGWVNKVGLGDIGQQINAFYQKQTSLLADNRAKLPRQQQIVRGNAANSQQRANDQKLLQAFSAEVSRIKQEGNRVLSIANAFREHATDRHFKNNTIQELRKICQMCRAFQAKYHSKFANHDRFSDIVRIQARAQDGITAVERMHKEAINFQTLKGAEAARSFRHADELEKRRKSVNEEHEFLKLQHEEEQRKQQQQREACQNDGALARFFSAQDGPRPFNDGVHAN